MDTYKLLMYVTGFMILFIIGLFLNMLVMVIPDPYLSFGITSIISSTMYVAINTPWSDVIKELA